MSDIIISNTEFLRADVLQASLWANPEQPGDDVTLYAELSLDARASALKRSADGRLSKRLTLTVSVVAHDDDEEGIERMRAQVTLSGGSQTVGREGASDEEIDRHLAVNTVAALYATARTYLEFNTSMMPIKRFTLPAIDPYRVVDGRD